MKKTKRKYKKKAKSSNKCEKCGGSKSNYADDYFIKKCWCFEFQIMEGDDFNE